jgi:hypothetical protein
VNRLPAAGEHAWRLPRHAHLVVYEADDGGGLLTVYDCGARPSPSARLLGRLVGVDARHERTRTPTGAVVRMREPSTLVAREEGAVAVRPSGSR